MSTDKNIDLTAILRERDLMLKAKELLADKETLRLYMEYLISCKEKLNRKEIDEYGNNPKVWLYENYLKEEFSDIQVDLAVKLINQSIYKSYE